MNHERLDELIELVAKGDTTLIESFFNRPGGRKHLENIILIIINTLPGTRHQHEELYFAFVEVLNRMEQRIKRQKEGQLILQDVFQ